MSVRKIALYGYKGVGSTTVAMNVAAALAEAGSRVVVIGCDRESDSTNVLHPRKAVKPLVEEPSTDPTVPDQYVVEGFKGIRSVVFGRFRNGDDFLSARKRLKSLDEEFERSADIVIYDVTGDPQEILVPLAEDRFFDEVLIVSSAEAAALRAVNHLVRLQKIGILPRNLKISGLVGNHLQSTYADLVIEDYARKINLPMIARIPRSLVVYRCEFFGETLVEAAPLAYHTYLYRKIGKQILAGLPAASAESLSAEEFLDWSLDWGDRLYDLGEGVVDVGSSI